MSRSRLVRIGLPITAALVAMAVVLGLIGWYVVAPVYRPTLRPGEIYALDVSHHQGEIDWQQVAADDIDAVVIKATEGQGWVDPRFAENWAGAEDAGIRRGAYHFFTLCAPGAAQAENFLQTAPPGPDVLFPALDLELIGSCSDRPDQAVVDAELTDFVTAVEAAWGRPLLVYARHSFTSEYTIDPVEGRPRWRTNFFLRPFTDDWAVWQVQYWAKVDGIDGGVDLNMVRLTG